MRKKTKMYNVIFRSVIYKYRVEIKKKGQRYATCRKLMMSKITIKNRNELFRVEVKLVYYACNNNIIKFVLTNHCKKITYQMD